MDVRLDEHAMDRLRSRGATVEEVIETVLSGAATAANLGRTRFSKSFQFGRTWRGVFYSQKLVEAYAVLEDGWLVITVIVKYY